MPAVGSKRLNRTRSWSLGAPHRSSGSPSGPPFESPPLLRIQGIAVPCPCRVGRLTEHSQHQVNFDTEDSGCPWKPLQNTVFVSPIGARTMQTNSVQPDRTLA